MWQSLKIWHTCERLMGVQIDTTDVWVKLKDLMEVEIQVLQQLHGKGGLAPDAQVWLKELGERRAKLLENQKYQDLTISRIMAWGRMKVGRPSRTSKMSLAAEKLGWKLSMRSWDRAVWLAGPGGSVGDGLGGLGVW